MQQEWGKMWGGGGKGKEIEVLRGDGLKEEDRWKEGRGGRCHA